jgi:predicted nucleic acid-binding Zn ribbon protein
MTRMQERAEYERRRRGRNLALLAVLVGVIVLLYVLSFVRMAVQ